MHWLKKSIKIHKNFLSLILLKVNSIIITLLKSLAMCKETNMLKILDWVHYI